MFLKRLQEEGEEEEEAGLLNLLFLTLVSFPGWKKKTRWFYQTAPVRRYVTIYQVKPRDMAQVVQWKFTLPYVSKVREISLLRLSV